MGNIVGIDLGTTFSGLAVLNELGKPETIPDADAERITPSAVYFDEDDPGRCLIGREAIRARRTNYGRCVRWIKRHMQEPDYRVNIDGCEWSASELSSFIIKKLKKDCSNQIGNITDAIITVPAHFDEVGRKATMDAGETAGLDVIGIINEPTAAAVYYALTHDATGRILVFDLGGGTFDITIMDIAGSKTNIICSAGDHRLGGYDFDQKLLARIESAYEQQCGGKLYSTDERKAGFEDTAESLKKTLSKRPNVKTRLVGQDGEMAYEVTREEFEEAISPFLAKIDMLVETALEEAGHGPSGINEIILVGGSTRIPVVRQRLEKMFGYPPTTAVNVDECVALGAALYAGLRLSEEQPEKVAGGVAAALAEAQVTDVCNHSYGTTCLNIDEETGRPSDDNAILITKNSQIPCEVTKEFYTVFDGQEVVEADVTQGESTDPDYVKILARKELRLPPNRPALRPIKVTYSYDKDQRMHCVFEDEESGRRVEMDIDAQAGGVSKEQVAERKAALEDFIVE